MTTCAPTDLAEDISALSIEAAGLMGVVRPQDELGLLAAALADDDDSLRIFSAISQAQAGIVRALRRSPMLCTGCPRQLRNNNYAFCVALACRDAPIQALGMAVCTRCATETGEIKSRAFGALRKIWPYLRPIEVTHPRGGTA